MCYSTVTKFLHIFVNHSHYPLFGKRIQSDLFQSLAKIKVPIKFLAWRHQCNLFLQNVITPNSLRSNDISPKPLRQLC